MKKRQRKRKSRARIKEETSKRNDIDMTPNAISDNKKEKEEKAKTSENNQGNLVSSSNLATQPSKEEQKITAVATDTDTTTGIPEVFDSSRYNAMAEMKESANMKEEEHLKEVLSSVEKEQPLKAETVTINDKNVSTNIDTNLSPTPSSTVYSVDTSLDERAAILRGSKEDALDPEYNKSKISKGKEQEEDDKQQPYYSPSLFTAYMNSWYNSANAWTDMYYEFIRSAAKITEYWLDLFSKPWSGLYYKRMREE